MFKEMNPKTKKYLIIAAIVVVVIVVIIMIWRRNKKKKLAQQQQEVPPQQRQAQPVSEQQQPVRRSQVVPEEDRMAPRAEKPVSVEQAVEQAPRSTGNGNSGNKPKPQGGGQPSQPKGSTLPAEFMINANEPGADPSQVENAG